MNLFPADWILSTFSITGSVIGAVADAFGHRRVRESCLLYYWEKSRRPRPQNRDFRNMGCDLMVVYIDSKVQ
jgi:hypothetical protein